MSCVIISAVFSTVRISPFSVTLPQPIERLYTDFKVAMVTAGACIKINSPLVDIHGPGDTGSGGAFGEGYIPAEYIYAYMCPVRKVFMNVYKDPMDGMWYRLRLSCGCAECADEAETNHIKNKVEREVTRDTLADEMYSTDEEDVVQQKGSEQGPKGVSESALDAKDETGGWGGNGGIAVNATRTQKGDD